jgi:hypothetical protein
LAIITTLAMTIHMEDMITVIPIHMQRPATMTTVTITKVPLTAMPAILMKMRI